MVHACQRTIPHLLSEGGEGDIQVGVSLEGNPGHTQRRCPQSTEGVTPLLDIAPASMAGVIEIGSKLVGADLASFSGGKRSNPWVYYVDLTCRLAIE